MVKPIFIRLNFTLALCSWLMHLCIYLNASLTATQHFPYRLCKCQRCLNISSNLPSSLQHSSLTVLVIKQFANYLIYMAKKSDEIMVPCDPIVYPVVTWIHHLEIMLGFTSCTLHQIASNKHLLLYTVVLLLCYIYIEREREIYRDRKL